MPAFSFLVKIKSTCSKYGLYTSASCRLAICNVTGLFCKQKQQFSRILTLSLQFLLEAVKMLHKTFLIFFSCTDN